MSGGMERESDDKLACFAQCYSCKDPADCRRHPVASAAERMVKTLQSDAAPSTASQHLDAVRAIIASRGEERDLPDGERSMVRATSIFNACTGQTLSESDGWLFMICLKISRQRAGRFKLDDYHDLIGYAALQTECAASENAKKP